MNYQAGTKPRIINCHTHIFTADHVPPRLGRTFLPLGLDRIFTTGFIVALGRWWFRGDFVYAIKRLPKSRLFQSLYSIARIVRRTGIGEFVMHLIGYWLTIHAFFYCYYFMSRLIKPATGGTQVDSLWHWFKTSPFFMDIGSPWLKLSLVIAVLLFFSSGRNLLFFIFKKLFKLIAALPGKQTFSYIERYLMLGRFAIYQNQFGIFSRLRKQYPQDSAFVILPMDMEFMGAGKPKDDFAFKKQMEELVELKRDHRDAVYPFVFIHPERMKDKTFFNYSIVNKEVLLDPSCDLKRYMEDEKFAGFKIYPALGYFPFDEALLPLWHYAQAKNIPIMTHCIIGTIFDRGREIWKLKEHPILREAKTVETEEKEAEGVSADEVVDKAMKRNKRTQPPKYEYHPLRFRELSNNDFQRNFTHPLNYLCLLDDDLLLRVVNRAKGKKVKELFCIDEKLDRSLQGLKICFAHFGGDDQWQKHFEMDRHNFVHQLTIRPDKGIDFFETHGKPRPGKIGLLWNDQADWYSIICSMILQYPNIYGDISYIINNDDIIPLLKKTLSKENLRLRSRVLFGTDFYVVRSHKSERQMLAEIQAALSEEEFDLIARNNPVEYLTSTRVKL